MNKVSAEQPMFAASIRKYVTSRYERKDPPESNQEFLELIKTFPSILEKKPIIVSPPENTEEGPVGNSTPELRRSSNALGVATASDAVSIKSDIVCKEEVERIPDMKIAEGDSISVVDSFSIGIAGNNEAHDGSSKSHNQENKRNSLLQESIRNSMVESNTYRRTTNDSKVNLTSFPSDISLRTDSSTSLPVMDDYYSDEAQKGEQSHEVLPLSSSNEDMDNTEDSVEDLTQVNF